MFVQLLFWGDGIRSIPAQAPEQETKYNELRTKNKNKKQGTRHKEQQKQETNTGNTQTKNKDQITEN